MDIYPLLYLKWITNKDLLYSTGNSVQCCVAAWGRGVWGRMDMYALLYLKWITNKDLLYSTQNSAHYSVEAWREGNLGEGGYM